MLPQCAPPEGLAYAQHEMTAFDVLDRDGDGFVTREEFEGRPEKERSGTPHRRQRGWRTRPAPCGSCRCCLCDGPRFSGSAEDSQALRRTFEHLSDRLDRVVSRLEGGSCAEPPFLQPSEQQEQEPLAVSHQQQEEGVARAEDDKPRLLRAGAGRMSSGILGSFDGQTSTMPQTEAALLREKREKWLNRFSIVLIAVNAVYLGIEAELEMRSARAGRLAPHFLTWVNTLFALAFTFEFAMKAWLVRSGLWKRREERWWNLIDAILVLTAILDSMFTFFNLAYLRVLRILRAVKAVRIIRVIGKVHNLRLMVASIVTSFSTLCWACVLLGLVIFMCTLLIMPGVQLKVLAAGDGELAEVGGSGEITKESTFSWKVSEVDHFRSLASTALTLFMSITGGVDWSEVLLDIQKVHPIYAPFFVIFVAISTFSLTGVLTAVIIEASKGILWVDKELVIQKGMRDEEEKRGHLRELFQSIQRDGVIGQRRLQKSLDKEEHKALFKSLELDVWHTRNLFDFLDVDKSESVNEEEFVDGLMKHRGVINTVLDANGRLGHKVDALSRLLTGAISTGAGRRLTTTASSLSGGTAPSYELLIDSAR